MTMDVTVAACQRGDSKCFCQERFKRHLLNIGAGVEDVREDAAEFSVRVRSEADITEMMPPGFNSLSSVTSVGPGLVVVKVVPDPTCERDAIQQLVTLLSDVPAPIAGILLVAINERHSIQPTILQSSMATSFRNVSKGCIPLLVSVSFNARVWEERVATLQRGRSCDPSEGSTEDEPRGRTLSRGGRDRRSHAPTRRVLSSDAESRPRPISIQQWGVLPSESPTPGRNCI